jgi:hypothetical protein
MMLGVSSTNEMVERDAKSYLHEWLKYHPDFSMLPGVQGDDNLDLQQIKGIFEGAHMMKP